MNAPQGDRTTTHRAAAQGTTDRPPARRTSATATVGTVAALTAVVLLAAAAGPPWTWAAPDWLRQLAERPEPDATPPPVPTPTVTAPPPEIPLDNGGFGVGDYLLAVAALILLVLAALVARNVLARLRRRHTAPDLVATDPGDTVLATAEDDVVPRLRHAVRRATDQLDPTTPPRDAVIAAWVALEHAAARAGARRDPAQTPTEFTVAVLARTPADPDAVTTLRTLYHRARFGDRDLDTHDVDTARTALRRLARDLDAEPATTHPTDRPSRPATPGTP